MRVSPSASEIRRIVKQVFLQLGAAIDAPGLEERLRIENGKLAARVYQADSLMAMWFIEHGLLQFYDADGNMLHTVNLLIIAPADRAAA
jgi:hypothetical protein